MRRRATIVVLAIGIAVTGCGGDDSAPAGDTIETPTATPSPSTAAIGLPPEFIQCMADQGYAIESADDIHSAPQEVLQTCFGSLHEGGGTP